MCTGEGLAGHAELLSTMDARDYLGDIRIPMLILPPTKGSLANLDGGIRRGSYMRKLLDRSLKWLMEPVTRFTSIVQRNARRST